MPTILLHAEIPFPEQADGTGPLDVVLPRHSNERLYAALEKLPEGGSQWVNAKNGIDVVVGAIVNHPDVPERMSAMLRTLDMIEVTRRNSQLILVDFEPKRDPDARETMADVVQETRGAANAGDTIVGAKDDTSVIKPGKQSGPRKLSPEDWAKIKSEQPTDAAQAAGSMMKKRFTR